MDGLVRVVGFDPGGTTGYAVFVGTEAVESGEIPGGVEGFLEWWADNIDDGVISLVDEIVVEDFVVEPSFVGKPVASEIIGAVRALWAGKLTVQSRAMKATMFRQVFSGDRGEMERRAWLAERGLFFTSGHAMDAATHALVAKKRDMKFWRRYWV